IKHAVPVEVRLYDRLFKVEDISETEGDFIDYINPDSLKVLTAVYAESALQDAKMGERYQFLRNGYFTLDPDSSDKKLVFNRTVSLKDTWGKEMNKIQ
ncbi:MAG: glutamine--tRNA ligase, partial [Bacteroidota bacterium]|nr:glutamine--tRNA ligase [Bacteroidota bacterium]